MKCDQNWAVSTDKRSISIFWSGQSPLESLSSPFLFIGGMHGDEPEGRYLANQFLKWLKSNNSSKSTWILIPDINPDGAHNNTRTNARGVDLNRNFPSSNWVQSAKENRYYPGPAPASEPETKAVVDLIQTTKPRVIVHFHSWKPCVVCTGEPGKKWARPLSECSGYEVVENIGYDTPGSLSQYGWWDRKIPVICVEEQEEVSEQQTWNTFGPGLQEIVS